MVTSRRNNVNLQTNLDHVANWSRKWLIKLSISKCKVMSINRETKMSPTILLLLEKVFSWKELIMKKIKES
jgi:hypothetical protein